MGSKSSSTTAKTENITTTNQNVSGLAEGAQGFTDVGSIDIDTVDDVIVDRAFDFGDTAFAFGGESLDFAGDGLSNILDFGADIVENQQLQLTDTLASINAANATSADLSNLSRQETIQNVSKFVAVAVVAVAGIWVATKAIKRVRK